VPGSRTRHLHRELEPFQRALQRSAIAGVDERIPEVAVEIADHDHVGVHEPDHRVATSVGGTNRNQLDGLAIHPKPHRVAHPIGHDRKPGRIPRGRWRRRRRRLTHHPFAQLLTREQHGAKLRERRVTGCVVAVDVRIDQEADGPRIDAPDCRQHLVANLQVLRIDHEDAVGAGEHADPAARAVRVARVHAFRTRQHVEVRRDFVGLDFDLVVLDPRLRPGARRQGRGNDEDEEQLFGSVH